MRMQDAPYIPCLKAEALRRVWVKHAVDGSLCTSVTRVPAQCSTVPHLVQAPNMVDPDTVPLPSSRSQTSVPTGAI